MLALWLSLVGCAMVRLPEPSETMVELARQSEPEASLESLHTGRTLAIQECAGCHPPPRPSFTLAPDWSEVFVEMTDKAELDPEQIRLIEIYLDAAAALPPEP